MFAHGETVTVLYPVEVVDPYSSESSLADWDDDENPPNHLDIPGCGVADGGSLEPAQSERNSVVSDFDVIMPPGSDVTPKDRLVVRGLVCKVEGRPFEWRNPFTGWTPGVLVRAKIVEG